MSVLSDIEPDLARAIAKARLEYVQRNATLPDGTVDPTRAEMLNQVVDANVDFDRRIDGTMVAVVTVAPDMARFEALAAQVQP